MSELNKNYNWNGEYELLRDFKMKRFKVSDLKYPEYFHIFINEDNTLRYTIIDENFGMPCLANTMNVPHAIKLRNNCIKILNDLELDGCIKKINNRSDNMDTIEMIEDSEESIQEFHKRGWEDKTYL